MSKVWRHLFQSPIILIFLLYQICLCQSLPNHGKHYQVSLPPSPLSPLEFRGTSTNSPMAKVGAEFDAATTPTSKQPPGPVVTSWVISNPNHSNETASLIDDIQTRITHLIMEIMNQFSKINRKSAPSLTPELEALSIVVNIPVSGAGTAPRKMVLCRDQEADIIKSATNYGWIAASYGEIPINAFVAGEEKQDGGEAGKSIHIARASFNGSVIPGKAVPGHLAAYIGNGLWEMSAYVYEVFAYPPQILEWVDFNAIDDSVPSNAVVGGYESKNEEDKYVFIGRTLFEAKTYWGNYNLNMEVGAFYPGRKELQITYKYRSYSVQDKIQLLTWRLCE